MLYFLTAFIFCFMTSAHAADANMSREAIEKRIKPVGTVHVTTQQGVPQTDAATAGRTAEKIYQDHCKACHATGVANAPKLGDTAAWQLRAKQEFKVLVEHVIKGYKAMPPKGLCSDCSDQEIEATVKYMLQEAKIKS